ncbi:ankyrin repeat and LEM domain-containing protein 1-like [Cylas formicarius]|uniref:ankyrin repeat and LEM domain-containing protein 1-like n=1 Tax=Cylas formicarius TaxID=197179 RepID=UPI00295895EE|nr:ankyrin repeat and LEM domain-containing protein 1-like [Cylas formicarius]
MNKIFTSDKRELFLASLLYDSVEFRHFGSIKTLLCEKRADPNVILPKKGISAFHLAIGCDSSEFAIKVTAIILQCGGNPNVSSEDGLTPLHIAAAWGRADLLRMLLCCGGDPKVRDVNFKTPIHYACEGGFSDCINLLKSYLHAKSEVMTDDDKDLYSLVFDKILIDNGEFVRELNVINEQPPDSITKQETKTRTDLLLLPQADMTEYIMNWFNQQSNAKTNTPCLQIQEKMSDNGNFDFNDSSFDESDANYVNEKRTSREYITFRKMYRKTKKIDEKGPKISNRSTLNHTQINATVYHDACSDTALTNQKMAEFSGYSKESGIVTLPVSVDDVNYSWTELEQNETREVIEDKRDKSSDYMTCSRASVDTLERNILEINDDLSLNNEITKGVHQLHETHSTNNDLSFVSVISEVYKYVDNDEGVVLYERRLLKTPSECATSLKSTTLSSVSEELDYDTDTLRKELTLLGYNPGPITLTTKKVYLKKLHQLRRYPVIKEGAVIDQNKRTYSIELEKTIRNADWYNDIVAYKSLEEVLVKEFATPDEHRKWREGVCKSSFTYLLLDPRITNNLPCRSELLKPKEVWETFLSAIFYVGKGKRSRPYQHLYEAVDLWKKGLPVSNKKKIQKIFDIWSTGSGVICLHVYLNTIPVEAYTREAAMISALTINSLTNIKAGEFYGIPATWSQKQKKMLGVYLLYKAMMIFLNEGERQLCPMDID